MTRKAKQAKVPEPRNLADREERRRREEQLGRPHVQPLMSIVDRIRSERRLGAEVPAVDPADGGVNARLLLLMEAPGPKAVKTGFISMDNPDPTARNLRQFLKETGIPRSAVICWNAVPWYIGNKSGKNIRAAKGEDLEEGLDYLRMFLGQLPDLRAVVGLGRAAQRAWKRLAWSQHVPLIETYHPSNQALNLDPARRIAVRKALGGAARYVYGRGGIVAESAAEAEAQELLVPGVEAWFPFAHSLDGYRIAEELDIDLGESVQRLRSNYFETGEWRGARLELRLVLFYLAREKRFSDGPGVEDRPKDIQQIEDLLGAIRDG